MRVWRIAREPHCRDREGTGAFIAGGRWTPPGVRVLHAASSIALAGLEYLVHSASPPADLMLVAIDVPEATKVERPALDELPEDWASPLPSENCQAWGRKWCESKRALAVAVPSVIVPEERNYLINVGHSAMKGVALKSVRRFVFDQRLLRRP
jgi:RES domain-containing protein